MQAQISLGEGGGLAEGLHSSVAGLAAGLAADVIKNEEDVMLLMYVDRQLGHGLCKRKKGFSSQLNSFLKTLQAEA